MGFDTIYEFRRKIGTPHREQKKGHCDALALRENLFELHMNLSR